jgi:hypothetical protein
MIFELHRENFIEGWMKVSSMNDTYVSSNVTVVSEPKRMSFVGRFVNL